MSVYQDLLKPINDAVMAVNNLRDHNRDSPVFNQLSAVADSIMVLSWITIEFRPQKLVEESFSTAQYWGNRVLQDNKDKYVMEGGCFLILGG